MDFMKVFDQTVREIKREVNLKVLKIPEIEQKVLDATDDEPWGPHGTVLAEIAQATKKYTECQMIMNVLWTRLSETGKSWRLVYKALAVIEYLVANGSERAVDDIIEHTYQISSLTSFEYVEPSGKDLGINVRKKAETIVALLNDKDKIQEARDKAAANREKYFGLSSSGVTYKSGSASFSSSNFRSSDRYGGFGSSTFNGSYKDNDQYGEDKYVKTNKSKNEPSRHDSKKQDPSVTGASRASSKTTTTVKSAPVSSQSAPASKYDEDFDDFDPRGTSSSKPSAGSNQGDLFGQSLVDLWDAPVPLPTDSSTSSVNNSSEVDLFADANFVSAPPEPQSAKSTVPQTSVDLFASQPSPVSTPVDLFAAPDPVPVLDNNTSKSDTTSSTFDPFAAVPMNSFDGSDPLGTFASHTDPSPNGGTHEKVDESSVATKSPPKKEGFQVKSGIWADSLSRGLIDLNITAPTKVNLADIGIVGGLSDGSAETDKGGLPSFYMGQAMGTGSGAGRSSLTTTSTSAPTTSIDDFFSS
ncbi:hypothetical protein ACS0TY_022193 [Phlomoides rotata]